MFTLIKESLLKQKYLIIVVLTLQIFLIITSLVLPYLNGKFVDVLLAAKSFDQITNFILLISIIGCLSFLVGYIYKLNFSKFCQQISFNLECKVLSHMQKVHLEIFEKFEPTYLNQRIKNDCDTIINFWIKNIVSIIINLVAIIVMILLFYYVNFSLFFITLIFIPIYCIVYQLLKKPLFKRKHLCIEVSNIFFSKMNSFYSRNKEIKIKSSHDYEWQRIHNEFNKYYRETIRYLNFLYIFNAGDEFLSLIFQIIVFVIGGAQVINKSMTIGEFTIMTTYFNIIIEKIKYYFELGQEYQNTKVSTARIKELLSIRKEDNGKIKINNIKTIKLENVNYCFNSIKLYKKPISMIFDKPGVYVFIGNNGSGKTSLMNILIGINKMNLLGKVFYNDVDTNFIDMYSLRKEKISVMIQNEKLENRLVSEYLDSVCKFDVVSFYKDKEYYNEIFYSELFNIEKLLNKNLLSLSAGEKQMLILFICLTKDADIYILDEPTSNIHPDLAKKIMEFISDINNKFVLIITHEKLLNNFRNVIDIAQMTEL